MSKIFSQIGSWIEKYPVKVLLISVLLFALLVAGVSNMKMATGNETLVQNDNEVYVSNKEMEASFGGDSILVLFTDKSQGNLLSQENIEKMWNVEQRFKYDENIFSIMSPASIVHQMTDTQSNFIKEQILTLSDGLNDMSSKMAEIGTELNSKETMDPRVIEEKLNSLSGSTEVFNKLIADQNNMAAGAKELQGGLFSVSDGLGSVSSQLLQLSNMAGDNKELKAKLNVISENINKSSQGIRTMGEKTSFIQEGANNTSKALGNISSTLTAQTSSMEESLSGGISPDKLKEMADGFITMGEKLGDVSEGLRTFHSKSSMMVADIPTEQAELDNMLYDEDNKLRSIFSDVIINDENSLMVVKLQGNLGDEYKDSVSKDIAAALDKEGFESISYLVSGKPVLDSSLRTEMKSNMMMMVGMAAIIMLLVLAVVFKVKWRMLSLGIILVSVIATLGFMGHLSIPITMVSMAVFPILIGLGIDYSIQFHNRYEEEKSVKKTLGQIGKAVAVAVLATVLGFVSLYSSPVPMIQDFGKMLTIGVIISFIGGIFLLMPILHLRDKSYNGAETRLKPGKEIASTREPLLDKILKFSTKAVMKFAIPLLLITITASVMGFYADKKVGLETDIEAFMPQNMKALEDIHQIRDMVGSTDQMAIYIKDSNILKEENINWIRTKTSEIESKYKGIVVDVKSIDTIVNNLYADENLSNDEYVDAVNKLPEQQASMFVNDKRSEAVILLNIKHLGTGELQDFLTDLKNDLKDTSMDVKITGKSVLDIEMVNGLTSGRVKMTVLGLILVFAVLFIIYRNPIMALIPILPVVLIVGMSSGIMYLLGIDYTPITSTLGALVLGMGTEMTVMLMERYIEERKTGKGKMEAMIVAVTMIGKAIVASGLTTVGGFSVLILSKFVILKDFGLMTVINITLALLSTFIILPPVITLFDRFLFNKKVTATSQVTC